MRRGFALAALWLATAAAPYPLGVYVGNANGNEPAKMAEFKAAFDAHTRIVGAKPKFFNAFTDFAQPPEKWPEAAGWLAWSSAKSGDAYVGPGSGMIPLVGVPLASNAGGWGKVDAFYREIIAGKYDAVYAGVVDAWADNGYRTVDFRIAYEMNGNFMPWAPGNSNEPLARQHFVEAFRRVAAIIHRRGREKGITALVHWCPAGISWTGYDIATLYPGDAFVDVIAVDQYSPMYPRDLTDWASGGKVSAPDKATWASRPANRRHFWRHPNATRDDPAPKLGAWGWSIPMTIELAKKHGKPLGIDETGQGPSGSGLGPPDDPEFAPTLAAMLAEARAQQVPIRNVNIWNAKLGDGDWDFRSGGKPLAAKAWRAAFGARGASSAPRR